jgi:ADP-ribose pyrophosphatase YjhB (NUDIX family)
MTANNVPQWLAWARELQALSQTGLTYSQNEYDRERYQRLGEIAAEIVQDHTGLPPAETLADFRVQPGYATPKVDVRGAVVQDGRILLVQERVDGRWCMPGGWADVGAAPSEMVVREVWEESGFQVQPRKMVGVYDANSGREPQAFYHAYKLLFLCEITGGEARPSYETLAVAFFSFDDLPPLSWNRTNERHLRDVQAHLANGGLDATFD